MLALFEDALLCLLFTKGDDGGYHILINNIIITSGLKHNVFVHADAIIRSIKNECIVFKAKGVAR